MTEVTAVSAAQRARLVQDALRINDRSRDDLAQSRIRALEKAQKRSDLVAIQLDLDNERLRVRRDDQALERAQGDDFGEQQRVLDIVANDTQFQRTQDVIRGEINDARDARTNDEDLLLRQIAGQRNDVIEAQTLAQRAEDLRLALNDREDRIIERRIAERNEEIRQEIELRVSLDRVRSSASADTSREEPSRGNLVDVNA